LGGASIFVSAPDPNDSFNQDHFTGFVLSDLKQYGQNSRRRKESVELSVRMDNSHCRNGVGKVPCNHMMRLDYPPYSPKMSWFGFAVFGVLTNQVKETVFGKANEAEDFVSNCSTDMTLDEVPMVRHEWMTPLDCLRRR
jgi:hypothetical protein